MEKERRWKAMVAEDNEEMDKKVTGANKNEVVVELLSYSLQRYQDHQHQRTQYPPTPPHQSLRRDWPHHQKPLLQFINLQFNDRQVLVTHHLPQILHPIIKPCLRGIRIISRRTWGCNGGIMLTTSHIGTNKIMRIKIITQQYSGYICI